MPDLTPAEELRAAARLMRERAEKATPGPWKHMCLGSEGCLVIRDHGTIRERGHGRVARFGCKDWLGDHADAEFVSGMHPPVALAVADWLDVKAANLERVEIVGHHYRDHDYGYALAVARAYLKEAADA